MGLAISFSRSKLWDILPNNYKHINNAILKKYENWKPVKTILGSYVNSICK